jgi:hypothetical protein
MAFPKTLNPMTYSLSESPPHRAFDTGRWSSFSFAIHIAVSTMKATPARTPAMFFRVFSIPEEW